VTHPLLADRRANLPLPQAYSDCARVARRQARNFYYAFLPLPRPRRHALYAVYAFARLADDLADEESRPLEERMRALDELELRLEASLQGEAAGSVFIALKDAIGRYRIPVQALRDLLEGGRRDQTVTRYGTWKELEDYCYHVAGTVGLVCAAVFGAQGPQAERYAVAQGLGMQLVNMMRDVAEDFENGRVYLPAELMDAHGVTEEDLASGTMPAGWAPLMEEMADRARTALAEGERLLPMVAPEARICPALLRDLYVTILDRIEAAGWDVYEGDPDLGFARKVRLMFSAWWRFRIRP
jgi:phytoene synthase